MVPFLIFHREDVELPVEARNARSYEFEAPVWLDTDREKQPKPILRVLHILVQMLF